MAVSLAFFSISSLIDDYMSPTVRCQQAGAVCDEMALGRLLRELHREGLWPLPRAPYRGVPFGVVAYTLRKLRLASFCQQLWEADEAGGQGGKTPRPQCGGMRAVLDGALEGLRAVLGGLDVDEFC